MDRNGYNPSILATEDGVCVVCGLCCKTVRHEVFPGTANRALCKRFGLWVYVCPRCHARIHAEPDGDENQYLRQIAKARFLRAGHTEEEFIQIFERGFIKHWEL